MNRNSKNYICLDRYGDAFWHSIFGCLLMHSCGGFSWKKKQECHPTGCLVNQSRGQDGNQFCPVQFTSAVWSALDIRKKQGHNSQVSYWPDQHQKTRRTPYLGMLLRRQPFVWCTVSGLKQKKFLSQHIWDPCERSQSHHFLHVLCNGKSHRMVKP